MCSGHQDSARSPGAACVLRASLYSSKSQSSADAPTKKRLAPATQAEHEVERRLLLDVVVGKRAAVLELLAREDQALLVGGDALLVLDLGLDHVDRVRGLDLEGDGLACQRLDENLHCFCSVAGAFASVNAASDVGARRSPC